MAKVGSTRSYRKCGSKNNIRRAHANDVLRRTDRREKREFILYFCGPEDNDRRVFLEKRVPRDNLFGVDDSKQNVHAVRDRRNFAIHGRIEEVLYAWPKERTCCALMIDTCDGYKPDFFMRLWPAFWSPAFRNAIVMINMLRGRDAESNEIRAWLTRAGLVRDKHRGRALMLEKAYGASVGSVLVGNGGEWLLTGEPEALNEDAKARVLKREQDFRPKYYSYRSGKQTFDSVIFEPLERCVPMAMDRDHCLWYEKTFLRPRRMEGLRRRLRAQFAMRTMRQRGTFPSVPA